MSGKKKQKPEEKSKASKTIQVVGVGASAGGLEALQVFFRNMPSDTGLAFVVIQHLSPDYKSMMDELLARHTEMSIEVISDGKEIKSDTIYLIPPRMNLRIFGNKLFLTKQDPGKGGLNLPIDIFFRSLAEEKGKDAIAVILSGTGSDGTMGTRAIKEKNGMVMVQDEKTAKFNGMPSSAISTGLVDYVISPAEMGDEISNYLKHPFIRKDKKNTLDSLKGVDSISKVVLLLRDYSGIDFSYYKENTVHRRLERRISINRRNSLDEYLPLLEDSDREKEILYREFLIGVTQFFRDKEAFESLKKNVIPELFKSGSRNIRAWTTGCSTGEEAYSLAILMMEVAEQLQYRGEIKIFASDIDRKSIEIAGKGYYPDSIVADMDPELLQKYFKRKDGGYLISEEVRNNIVFATHNVLKDPPFSKLDLVVCRNLFIYLKPEVQTNLLSRFYYSLNSEGFLFMGSSETLGGMSEAFEIIDVKNKIYKYKKGFSPPIIDSLSLDMQNLSSLQKNPQRSRSQKSEMKPDEIMNAILKEYVPPSIIVDSNYLIVNVINDINQFTEIQSGAYSNELFSILAKDLSLFVNNILRQLKSGKRKRMSRKVTGLKNMKKRAVKIEAKVIEKNGSDFYMLSFELLNQEKTKESQPSSEEAEFTLEQGERVTELEKELSSTKENLAATVEELESANEELQSSNEELIASNEELQSTNEELQSVNEELYTVNSEHQEKIEELIRLNNDINNLLKNTEIAAIYLDGNMRIRKITPHVSKYTYILDSDIGRPITHLSVMDTYPELSNDVEQVLETLKPVDKEILGQDDNPLFARIRPYRTQNNAVDGVLITLIDVSELKKLQLEYNQTYTRLDNSMNIGNMAWWQWDIKTGKVTYDDRKATMLGFKPKDFPDEVYKICELIHPDDYEETMEKMRDVIEGKLSQWNAEYRMKTVKGDYLWLRDQGSIKSRDEEGKPLLMIGMVIDVSDYRKIEDSLKINLELLNLIFDNTPISTTLVDKDGNITFANKQAEKVYSISQAEITNRSYNANEWKITDPDGNPIKDKDLPFSIIKKTKKQVSGYKLCIETPPRNKKVLLEIDGAPVLSKNGKFEGAVFAMRSKNQ